MNQIPISKPDTPIAPGLHIVATPIGNLADLSPRGRDVLSDVDVIACEDKRHTAKLLNHYGIRTPMTAYHDHNAERARPALLRRLADGGAVALVSDAGTPLMSDPGYKLVREAIDAGIAVTGVPGPNAAMLALVLSGLPTDRFMFAGFLPPKSAARRSAFEEFRSVPTTVVIHESARRLAASLRDAAEVLGPRAAVVARELTKRHEEVRRGTLDDLAGWYEAEGAPKGEVTVVIGPPANDRVEVDETALDARLDVLLETLSVRDASVRLAAETGMARRTIYERALARRRNT